MGTPLNTKHLRHYRDIAWLLLKHGRADVVNDADLASLAADSDQSAEPVDTPAPEHLARDLERMGSTYVKLGQLLSTRADLIAPEYLEALARLQDHVEPFSFEQVEQIVTTELGARLSKLFAEFEAQPLASASLGQVHRAKLRDGRAVVVKVQRPDIREQMVEDLEALTEVAEFLDQNTEVGRKYEFLPMVEELRRSLINELDYRQEARNLRTISANLEAFDRLVVPRPVEDYTSTRVLTMEHIHGRKVTGVSPLRRLEMDGDALADQLFHAYLQQILVDGFFHADPHPGNVYLTDDDRIALLDFGMVGQTTPVLRDKLLKLVLAVSEGQADAAARQALSMGAKKRDFDETAFHREVATLVSAQQQVSLAQMNVGRVLLQVKAIAAECGFSLQPEITMIGKALLNLDQVGRTLAPEFDPNDAVRRHASHIMQRRMMSSLSPGSLFSNLLEVKETIEELPSQINTILRRLANNEVAIKVDAIDERRLLDGMQQIANRITMGLILAALVIGAAMLMDVPTDFRLLGYPGLAMIFFIAAACGGLVLIFNMWRSDRRNRQR